MSSKGKGQRGQAYRQRGQSITRTSQQSKTPTIKRMTAKALMAKDSRDLEHFCPNRLQLQWNLPGHLLTNKFFADHYAAIVSNVKLHVDDMFGVGDLPPQGSVWTIAAERKNRDLEHVIRAIARPNPSDQSPWDELMMCNTKRIAVMRGVFMAIYSEQLFSMQLFGADDTQRQTLERQDKQFIGHEGFRRSKLRATTVRMMLAESHGLPPLFWAQVDQFASKVFKLLHPVLTWVRMTWPENGTNPSIQSIFQMIHKDTAYAAWLAVNVRTSPTVLNFDWKLPGERYLPGQVELYPEVYTKHRHEVAPAYRVAHPGAHSAKPPARTARVMISVVPLVQMITLIAGNDGEEPVGFQKTTLIAPRVVYYHGLDNDQDDAVQFKEGPSRHSNRCLLTRVVCVYSSVCMVVLALVLLFPLPYLGNFRSWLNTS